MSIITYILLGILCTWPDGWLITDWTLLYLVSYYREMHQIQECREGRHATPDSPVRKEKFFPVAFPMDNQSTTMHQVIEYCPCSFCGKQILGTTRVIFSENISHK